MKREKIFYITAIVLLAAALVAALVYKRPLDIKTLTGVTEPDDIAITAVFVMPDGTRQTQPLQTYSGLYSGSLPDVANLVDADLQGRAQLENGKLTSYAGDATIFAGKAGL